MSSTGPTKKDASDQINLGTALTRIKHYLAAAEVLTRAMELAPTNAKGFGDLGVCFYFIDNCDDALIAFARALALDPANPRAGDWNRRCGSCSNYMKDYAKAEQNCAKARRLPPNDPAPRLCLGQAQFNRAKYVDALSSYREAYYMKDSDAYSPLKTEALYGVFASLARLKKLNEAESILKLTPGKYSAATIERMAADAMAVMQRGAIAQY